jgi:N-acetylneuraminate synthase
VRVGYSDHTLGVNVSLAAVALGAEIVEKHFTLDKAEGGVDSAFSSDPEELRLLAQGVKEVALSLGVSDAWSTEAESESRRLRPSLYVSMDVKKGEIVSAKNVRSVRPAGGLPPKEITNSLGSKFREDLPAGTPLAWVHLE